MKVERRIPTLLGIMIIVVSLSLTIFLSENIRTYLSRATPNITPSEIKTTNISDSGFTVSWITTGSVSGAISFGENSSLGSIAPDDRDQISGKTGEYTTHHVTLKYLKPATTYYFKIVSGGKFFDNDGQAYVLTTAPTTTSTPQTIDPAFGTIQKSDNMPAEGAIVYLTSPTTTPLSTLVKPSGSWLINLSSVRTSDLSNFVKFSGGEKIEIFVQAGFEGNARAVTTIGNHSPVPKISLGKTFDFSQEVSLMPSPAATPTASPPTGGFEFPPPATPSVSLTSPASESAIPSDRPLFSGTGVPEETVIIEIESPAPLKEIVKVDRNGNWSWTPPLALSVGKHVITVTTTDANGNLVRFVRNFVVLASGTQVTEAATPPATIKPSPTATPTPTPRPSPTIIPSPTPVPPTVPPSGNLTPTFLIAVLGLIFVVLGIGHLLLFDNS